MSDDSANYAMVILDDYLAVNGHNGVHDASDVDVAKRIRRAMIVALEISRDIINSKFHVASLEVPALAALTIVFLAQVLLLAIGIANAMQIKRKGRSASDSLLARLMRVVVAAFGVSACCSPMAMLWVVMSAQWLELGAPAQGWPTWSVIVCAACAAMFSATLVVLMVRRRLCLCFDHSVPDSQSILEG